VHLSSFLSEALILTSVLSDAAEISFKKFVRDDELTLEQRILRSKGSFWNTEVKNNKKFEQTIRDQVVLSDLVRSIPSRNKLWYYARRKSGIISGNMTTIKYCSSISIAVRT
jgi:hypothetical protein